MSNGFKCVSILVFHRYFIQLIHLTHLVHNQMKRACLMFLAGKKFHALKICPQGVWKWKRLRKGGKKKIQLFIMKTFQTVGGGLCESGEGIIS